MAVAAPTAPALSLRGVVKSFGGRLILDGADLELGPRARVGLIGANGAGKSTLLAMLAGEEHADAGAVTLRRGARVAYLHQLVAGDERTVRQVLAAARPEAAALEEELARVEAQLADPALVADLDRMGRVLERQAAPDRAPRAPTPPAATPSATCATSASPTRTSTAPRACSAAASASSWRSPRASCRRPTCCCSTSPRRTSTSRAGAIVEELVQDFDGAVLIVSHDRHLLDETVTQIAELEGGRIRMWQGGYSAYAVARELELVRRQQQYVTQQKEIARLEEAIRRFKDWAHRVVDERHIKRARNKQRRSTAWRRSSAPSSSGARWRSPCAARRAAATASSRCAAWTSPPSCDGVELEIVRGERVGIVGPIGAGKTVLARLLAGDLQPTAGERWAGPSISVEYVSQAATELPGDRTPIDVVRAARPLSEGEAVSLLVRFLFDYEQLRRPIASMSGGERTRLRCCLVMLSAANCLILDEPTNHLDIPAVETLEAALESYDGTVIAVSHDRYFLERIADRVLEVGGGRVRER